MVVRSRVCAPNTNLPKDLGVNDLAICSDSPVFARGRNSLRTTM